MRSVDPPPSFAPGPGCASAGKPRRAATARTIRVRLTSSLFLLLDLLLGLRGPRLEVGRHPVDLGLDAVGVATGPLAVGRAQVGVGGHRAQFLQAIAQGPDLVLEVPGRLLPFALRTGELLDGPERLVDHLPGLHIELLAALDVRPRLGLVAHHGVGDRPLQVGGRAVGLDRDRALEVLHRRLGLTVVEKPRGAVHERPDVVGIRLEPEVGLLEVDRRLRGWFEQLELLLDLPDARFEALLLRGIGGELDLLGQALQLHLELQDSIVGIRLALHVGLPGFHVLVLHRGGVALRADGPLEADLQIPDGGLDAGALLVVRGVLERRVEAGDLLLQGLLVVGDLLRPVLVLRRRNGDDVGGRGFPSGGGLAGDEEPEQPHQQGRGERQRQEVLPLARSGEARGRPGEAGPLGREPREVGAAAGALGKVVADARRRVRVEEPVGEILEIDDPALHGRYSFSRARRTFRIARKNRTRRCSTGMSRCAAISFGGTPWIRWRISGALSSGSSRSRARRMRASSSPCSSAWSGRRTSTSGDGGRADWRTARRRTASRRTLAAMVKTQCSNGAAGRYESRLRRTRRQVSWTASWASWRLWRRARARARSEGRSFSRTSPGASGRACLSPSSVSSESTATSRICTVKRAVRQAITGNSKVPDSGLDVEKAADRAGVSPL